VPDPAPGWVQPSQRAAYSPERAQLEGLLEARLPHVLANSERQPDWQREERSWEPGFDAKRHSATCPEREEGPSPKAKQA